MTVDEEAELILQLPEQDVIIVGDDSSLAPVIIEELHESEMMDVNMSEFVEARALKIHKVNENTSMDQDHLEDHDLGFDLSDPEDLDILTAEEEDLLTKQFLDGVLTFSEYSLRMDRGIDLERTEAESVRFVLSSKLWRTSLSFI